MRLAYRVDWTPFHADAAAVTSTCTIEVLQVHHACFFNYIQKVS